MEDLMKVRLGCIRHERSGVWFAPAYQHRPGFFLVWRIGFTQIMRKPSLALLQLESGMKGMREKIGKFQVRSLIGKGAMGEVYLGVDPILGREVAIKTILPGTAFGEEAQARFEREARATGSLNHPHIVTVYEFGEDEDLHYLAMEFVQGEDLETLIRGERFTKIELLELVAQVCEGLGYAHAKGVIHRDIKPSNILVAMGKKPVAKLMDFGVALISQSDLTQKGVWMGTVNYMAPEYLDTGKATPSSDIFAVGVMLYEVITGGRKPFSGETVTTVLNAILRSAPGPIAPDEAEGVPPQILAVVRRSLEREPRDRYATAEELAAAIRKALHAQEPPVKTSGGSRPLPKRVPTDKLIIVGKGGRAHCLSLRVALRQAEPGVQILVLPGHYRENVVVDKDVTIQGEGDPSQVILESPKGACMTLQSGRVAIQGLTFRKSWAPGKDPDPAPAVLLLSGQAELGNCEILSDCEPAVVLQGPGNAMTLRNCTLGGEGTVGLLAKSGAMATMEGCVLKGHREAEVRALEGSHLALNRCALRQSEGVGIQMNDGSQATLEDCELENLAGGGIEADRGSRVVLRRCHLQGSRFAGVLAMEKSQVFAEDSEFSGHGGAGLHATGGASSHLSQCRFHDNEGFGVSLLDQSIATFDDCDIYANAHPGLMVHRGATAQLKQCKLRDGLSWGVVSSAKGRGVLEGCEIFGNARSGAKVEAGGSLLLVRCAIRDGQDTGLLLFEDGEATLEECVVHRNARGGILLAKDASDPVLRGGNRIEDEMLREGLEGGLVKLAPVQK